MAIYLKIWKSRHELGGAFFLGGFDLRLKFVLAETRKNLIESLILYLVVSLSFFIILRVYKVDMFWEALKISQLAIFLKFWTLL